MESVRYGSDRHGLSIAAALGVEAQKPMITRATRRQTKGAFGKHARTLARKAAFLAASSQQGNELAKNKQLRRAYADFYATREGREFAKEFGKSYQDSSHRPGGGNGSSDPEFHDPSDLPQASVIDNPVDHIEPRDSHADFIGLDRDQIDLVCETFKHVFRWTLDGAQSRNSDSALVSVGKRCNAVISRMRPDLGIGLSVSESLNRRLDQGFKPALLLKTGIWFGRVLEWLRRGDPLSARGERVYLLAYKLWPDDIGASTLAALGGMNGKTRQAKDKQVNCLRDTMGGLKALTMRPDITRARCRASQLENTI